MEDTENNDINDLRLAASQDTREKIVTKLIAKGIPSDKEEVELLLKVLDGIDRTAIGLKRISVEKSAADAAAMERRMIMSILGDRVDEISDAITKRHSGIAMVERVSEYKPMLGEMTSGGGNLTYEECFSSDVLPPGVA